tara:strand:- start:601 stop:762 length:162 start_codon:yes stop_codon:yes gene_type:complete
MSAIISIKWNYIVWVGDCSDYYVHYSDALTAFNNWLGKGYDDVIIEKIKKEKL